MLTTFNNIAIKGVTTAMPAFIEECGDVQYASIMGEKKLRRQIKMTGIERRRIIMNDQKTSDLAIDAVGELLKRTGWTAESVDILILVTQSQDMLLPATSMFVHRAFPFKENMTVFDINLGCSGFTTGLQVIANLLQNTGQRAILLTGDISKYNPEWKETGEWEREVSSWLMFGSGVSATAIEKEENHTLYGVQHVNGQGCMHIRKDFGHHTMMNGDAVFSFTLNEVVDSIRSFMKELHITDDDVDYYVFHQAQRMILDNVKDILEISDEKLLVSYKDYGNTSSASIPLTMSANRDAFVENTRVLMCGFGVGLAWSAVYTTIGKEAIFDVIDTENIYEYN